MTFEMRVLRIRFRSIFLLCVLGTAMLVVIYLPPAYHPSQLLLSSTASAAEGTADINLLQVRDAGSNITLSTPLTIVQKQDDVPPTDQAKGEGGEAPLKDSEEEDPKNISLEEPPPPETTSPLEIIKEAAAEVDHPLQDANEHDSYVQDYEDYTPANFVEVKKLKPAGLADDKKSNMAGETASKQSPPKIKDIKKELLQKKPARLKNAILSFDDKKPAKEFLPEVLRARALTFPQNSSMRIFLSEQDRRVDHVAETCKSLRVSGSTVHRGYGPPMGLSGLHNLLLDRVNNIAYCPVYKAASTTWSITMLEIQGIWDREHHQKNQRLQQIVGQVFPKISNFAGPSLTQGMTRFMVVRHPFERLLSCYRDKFEKAKKVFYYTRYGEKMVRNYRKFPKEISSTQLSMLQEQVRAKVKAEIPVILPGNPFADPVGPTFPEFVQYVTQTKHDDEHWRTYHDHCSPCHMQYQFILRFEDLNHEGKEFIEFLNRTSQVEMRWENPTKGGATNNFICEYYSQLTKDMLVALVGKYEKDFKLYEYKPDAYLDCVSDTDTGEKEVQEKEKLVKSPSIA